MRLAIALALALTAAPALAAPAMDFNNIQPGPRTEDGLALQPDYVDVIDVTVTHTTASNASGRDKCTVEGRVEHVFSGLHYRRGETAVVDVPCARSRVSQLQLLAFGGFWVDRDWLPGVRRAIIGLDDHGRVVSFASMLGLTRVY